MITISAIRIRGTTGVTIGMGRMLGTGHIRVVDRVAGRAMVDPGMVGPVMDDQVMAMVGRVMGTDDRAMVVLVMIVVMIVRVIRMAGLTDPLHRMRRMDQSRVRVNSRPGVA